MPEGGKTVFITGGSRGIGRAITLRLINEGFKKIIIGYLQNDEEAEKTLKWVEERNVECHLAKGNLADLNDIDRIFDKITPLTKHLDTFIHSAALNTFKPLSEIKPNQWDLTININTRSMLYCVQKCIPLMHNGGCVIGLSSIGSQKYLPNYGAMGPAKAAMESVIRYLAVELASKKIRVNGVSGGLIETESLKHFPDKQLIESYKLLSPAKRIGTPAEIAAVVAFLISSAAEYIYGQIIVVDGGISLL